MRNTFKWVSGRHFSIAAMAGFFGVLAATTAFATEAIHELYEIGTQRQNLLFRMKRIQEGGVIRNFFRYPDGKEAVNEEIVLENNRVKSIRIEQKQLGETYTAVVRDGVVFYTRTAGGKTKESHEDLPDDVLIGPQIVTFAAAHWDELMKGESKHFRIMVVDRQETFGFKIYKEDSESNDKTVTLKIKPSSVFIAAVVKPIAFRFDAKTRKVHTIIGRTAPKLRNGDKWSDLDAEMVFD